jgi:hypothetical protein
VNEGTKPEDQGREERLTTGPAHRADLTTRPSGLAPPARRGEEIILPCGRCRREFPVAKFGRLWRLPALLLWPFVGYPKQEMQAPYCPACRGTLNCCRLALLAAVCAVMVLARRGALPGQRDQPPPGVFRQGQK